MPEQIENRMVVESEWRWQSSKPDVYRICGCHNPIHYGEQYWDFDGDIVCKECIKDYLSDFRKVAE